MMIKRIGPLSCAKLAAVLYAALGLIIGTVFTLFAIGGGFATAAFAADPTRRVGALLGVGAIFAFPALYGVFGFVGALVGTTLYNVVAKFVGGIEVDVQ